MKNIVDTGLRGYLKWLQADQPAIYRMVAPQLVHYVPEAFSDYEQSQAMGALMGSTSGGWHSGVDWSDRPASAYTWNNAGNLATGRGMSVGLGGYTSGGWGNYFGHLGQQVSATDTGTTTTFDSTDTFNAAANPSDVATTANTGQASASTTSIIGQLVNAASQVFLAQQQAQTYQQLNQIQLQRVQAGLPPLTTSSNAIGIPQITGTAQASIGGGVGLAVAALLGFGFLMSRHARA